MLRLQCSYIVYAVVAGGSLKAPPLSAWHSKYSPASVPSAPPNSVMEAVPLASTGPPSTGKLSAVQSMHSASVLLRSLRCQHT